MARSFDRLRPFLADLKRRRVYRVGAVYAAAAFVVWEAADIVVPALHLPGWTLTLVVVLTILGFPVTLILAWMFDITPEGIRRTSHTDEGEAEEEEAAPLSRPLLRPALAALLGLGLFAGAGLVTWTIVAGPSDAGGDDHGAQPHQRSIAVLPFHVSGPGSEAWREGLVTLLSTGLDGAGGLRAVDSRTVLAQWDRVVSEGTPTDRGVNLAVAESTGATFALLGSAVSVGDRVRLLADVVEPATGRELGQGRVEGPRDSVLSLVDRLSVEVLRVVLEEEAGELSAVDVAAVTTQSVPALQAFLEGEAAHRRADFEAAIAAYRTAIEEDSTFALAHYRLAGALGWHGGLDDPSIRPGRHRRAAERFADRLPAREAALLRADNALRGGAPDALDSLVAVARRYPDDAEAWYLLGEGYRHHHLGSPADGEDAFGRAVRLDPGFAPYRIHHVELAFHHLLDSAEATRRTEAYREVVGSSDPFYPRTFGLGLALVFGSPGTRSEALAGLHAPDSATVASLESATFHSLLWHPMVQDVREAVGLALLGTAEASVRNWAARTLVRGSFSTGQVRKGLEYLDRFGIAWPAMACELAGAVQSPVPVPEEVVDEHVSDVPPDASDPCVALLGAAVGDAELYGRGVSAMEARVRKARAAGDTAAARAQERFLTGVEGLRLLARGRVGEARERLERSPSMPPAWLGEAHLRLGDMEQAAEFLGREWGGFGGLPLVRLRRARAYEALGQREKAAADYRYFAEVWERYADDELQPMAAEAREAIRSLEAAGR